jgi:hypothetical protein
MNKYKYMEKLYAYIYIHTNILTGGTGRSRLESNENIVHTYAATMDGW